MDKLYFGPTSPEPVESEKCPHCGQGKLKRAPFNVFFEIPTMSNERNMFRGNAEDVIAALEADKTLDVYEFCTEYNRTVRASELLDWEAKCNAHAKTHECNPDDIEALHPQQFKHEVHEFATAQAAVNFLNNETNKPNQTRSSTMEKLIANILAFNPQMTEAEATTLATQVMLANPTMPPFEALRIAMQVIAGEKTAANDILTNKPNLVKRTGGWISRAYSDTVDFITIKHPKAFTWGAIAVAAATGIVVEKSYGVADRVTSSVPWAKEPTIAVKGRVKM